MAQGVLETCALLLDGQALVLVNVHGQTVLTLTPDAARVLSGWLMDSVYQAENRVPIPEQNAPSTYIVQ